MTLSSSTKAWWKCPKGPDHEWTATVRNRSSESDRSRGGCPFCIGRKVSVTNSLATKNPEITAQWHPERNGDLTPDDVTVATKKKVWWKCPEGPDHEWQGAVGSRQRGRGCPFCSGKRASVTNSLAVQFPEIANEWHPTKNRDLTPDKVTFGSKKGVWWKCSKGPDHVWRATPNSRTGTGTGCPACAGYQLSGTNTLENTHPELARQWHLTKNGDLLPSQVVFGTDKWAWWQCPKDPDHTWRARVVWRTRQGQGCPYCNKGWTIASIRLFVKSLLDKGLLGSLVPAELWLLFQQNGLGANARRRTEFVKALTSGRLPVEELAAFAEGADAPKVESLFGDQSATEVVEADSADVRDEVIEAEVDLSQLGADPEAHLPALSARAILDSCESDVWSSADEEALNFLVASGIAKLWKLAYDPALLQATKDETKEPREGEYSERVQAQFRTELDAAESLTIPEGYSFRIDGKLTQPLLMQRHVAALVRDRRRVGNWSGTGAGKTLSAILASRVIAADLTVVLCPNSVVGRSGGIGWAHTIESVFPDSRVATKTLSPTWGRGDGPRYLVLNYESLQQPRSEADLAKFLTDHQVDLVVIDEIHYAKQRTQEASKRRRLTEGLCSTAAEHNPNLAVLAMSATPVINNLREGVSMVNLVTGIDHHDLGTAATVGNCMTLYQRFVSIGTRWMPPYPEHAESNPRIDVSSLVGQIRRLPTGTSGLLELEQMLVEAKLESILDCVQDGTLIYTQYVEGIVTTLTRALTKAGWKVGRMTGQDKTGLAPFLEGRVNVLIGSSAVATGVDGLQKRAARLIVACAPWTAAAYEQLVGRLVRQGQERPVEVIFPISFANVEGEEWSWCQSRLNRIEYKKGLADAAVDGVVPTGQLRTSTQAFQDALGWLQRLESGTTEEVRRSRITVPLSDEPGEVRKRVARYGDFSAMNSRWNATSSAKLHERLKNDPIEFGNYHTHYRKARVTWPVVPYEKIGDWIMRLPNNRVIGDFGCGEDLLGQRLRKAGYKVHSFDHVAISDDVVVCDIGQGVPLEEGELDVAVFSLSLMGSNHGDYLREAARALVFDGRSVICEATNRLPANEIIEDRLNQLGFVVTEITVDAQFTFIHALRTDTEPDPAGKLL